MSQDNVSTRAFLFKSAGIVAILTIASRLTGFLRDSFLADKFGAGKYVDAYQMGLRIPFVLFAAVNTALTTTFIPVFTHVREEQGLPAAFRTSSVVINFALLLGIVLVLLAEIFAVPVIRVVAPGFNREEVLLTAYLTRLMFPLILFQVLSGILTGILQSMDNFSLPALLGVLANTVVIAAIVVAPPAAGIAVAALGNTVSFMVIVLVQFPALYKLGFRWRPLFDWNDPGLRSMMKLVGPIVIGSGVQQVGLLVDFMLASTLAVGGISAFFYANRLFSLPGGTVGLAVYTVMYPTLTRLIVGGDDGGFKRALNESIRFLNFMLFPIMVVLILLRFPIIELAFQHGQFKYNPDTIRTAWALTFFSLGIMAGPVRDMAGRAFWSRKDIITPMLIGVTAVAINIGLDFALVHPLGVGGLALGTAAAAVVNAGLLLGMLKKKLGRIGGGLILSSFWRVALASGITGLVAVWSWRLFDLLWPGGHIVTQALRLFLAILSATATYLAATRAFRLPETSMVLRVLTHRAKLRA